MRKYDRIVELALKRGFFYPSAEIYNGPAGFWNYGPLGATLKRKIIDQWRKHIVKKDGMIELDGCQIMPGEVFKSSGHLSSFQDPLTKCTKCRRIFRADNLIEEETKKIIPEALSAEKFDSLLKKHKIKCPYCKGKLAKVRMFNLMIKTLLGPKQEEVAYLRPETCQSLFIDFPRIFRIMRCKLPIGFAQTGKSFRNEISPRQSLFRAREFTQAEVEIFFNPKKEHEFEKFDSVKNYILRFALLGKENKILELSCTDTLKKKISRSKVELYYLALLFKFYEALGFKKKSMRLRETGKDERPFYAKSAWDFEILTDLGWMELVANHYRADHDLGSHARGSKQDMKVMDDGEKVLPWVWEDSMGIDRTLYAVLDNAYTEETVRREKRVVLRLDRSIAPIEVAVFPLLNKPRLVNLARKVFEDLKKSGLDVIYDDSGSIGRRYRRMDQVGTPYCITIDYDSLKKKDVTVRDRDSMKQKRIKIKDLAKYLRGG